MNEFLKSKSYLYQYGNGLEDYFVFPKVEFQNVVSKPVKTQYEDSNFIDGAIRTNLTDRNKLGAVDLNVQFLVRDEDYFDLGYVKKVFQSIPRKLFSYTVDSNGDTRFYFTPYSDVIKTVSQEDKSSMENGQRIENVGISLKLQNPYWYECKPNISYFNKDSYAIGAKLFDNGLTFDSGVVFDEGIAVAKTSISSLSLKTKKVLFFDTPDPSYALVYVDKFFDKTSFGIEAGQETISQTLTDNSILDVTTTNIYRDTTAPNKTYLIEFTTLAQNEWVTIQNQSNTSSFKVTWLSASPSPSLFYYNSVWERFYDVNGNQIPMTSVKLDKVNPSDDFLYFSAMSTLNKVVVGETENIRLQKNSSTNETIKIEILNTYQI